MVVVGRDQAGSGGMWEMIGKWYGNEAGNVSNDSKLGSPVGGAVGQ